MPRPISTWILQLHGLIPMNSTVVLLNLCLFKKSCYKTPLFRSTDSFVGLFGGHVLVGSPVTCGISVIYRTSREPPTQNKDIFHWLDALLSVELNARHYASKLSFCFSSSNGKWKIGPYPFLKAILAIRNGPFQIFSAMAHGIPSMILPWSMDSIHCPCHGPCHGEPWIMDESWMAGHGVTTWVSMHFCTIKLKCEWRSLVSALVTSLIRIHWSFLFLSVIQCRV